MSLDVITKFAESDAFSAGNASWTVATSDLYGTSGSAFMAGGEGNDPDWSTPFQPAGMDEKPSRGFQGAEPHDGRAIGAGFLSLDELTNNRNRRTVPDYYRRPIGRGKFCGRVCCKGIDPATGRKVYRRINCGAWTCSYCGPRRARNARRAICAAAEGLGLNYFLTLTLDPKRVEHPKFYVPHLRMCFNKFREYLKRSFGEAPKFICVLEFTQKGVPHLHVLFDRYIEQHWISDVWNSLGGGRIVFIKRVTVRRVARYLSKYLTKDMLLSAPKGTRRITAARSIKLFPKFKSGIVWELLRSSIWQALAEEQMHQWARQMNLGESIGIEMDEQNYLKAFYVISTWDDEKRKGMKGTICELLTESCC